MCATRPLFWQTRLTKKCRSHIFDVHGTVWGTEYIFSKIWNMVSVSAHSAGAYTATLLVLVNVIRARGVRAPPTLTSQGQFYPHHWMYARRQRLQPCVLCGLWSPKRFGGRLVQQFGGFIRQINAPAHRRKYFQTYRPPKRWYGFFN